MNSRETEEGIVMLEINMDDVIAVIQSIRPQLIAIVVALLLGIILMAIAAIQLIFMNKED